MSVVHIGRPLQASRKWKGGTGHRSTTADELAETTVHYPQHGFTHVDAPRHMIRDGASLDGCALDQLCHAAAVVDVRDTVPNKPVTAQMLDERTGHAKAGDILLLHSGHAERYPADDPAYTHQSPWVDDDASRWIVEKGFRSLAVDFPQDRVAREMSARRVENEEFTEHRIVLGAGLMHLEHVCGLDRIGRERVFLAGLPLRLPGVADGGPASPVVLTEQAAGAARLLDLSTPLAPDHRQRVETYLTLSFEAGDPVQETGVTFHGHSHTHLLTPRYVDPNAAGVEAFIGAPVVRDFAVVELTDIADGSAISRDLLANRLSPDCDAVLLVTGFSDRVPYRDAGYESRSPFLEVGAARLLAERGIAVVAADFELDAGRKRLAGRTARLADLEAELALFGDGIALVKNLCGTTQLAEEAGTTLIVMPLLLPGAEAAPARVVSVAW